MDSSLNTIILEFLQSRPTGPAAQPFSFWCLAEITHQLGKLRYARHRLPLDLTNPQRSLEDLAIDIAGFYLSEKNEPQYHKIFYHLAVHGHAEFCSDNLPEVIRLLRIQIAGYTNKWVFKFLRQESPEIGKCKKALEAALNTLKSNGKIFFVEHDGGRWVSIHDAVNRRADSNLMPIPFLELVELVDEQYAFSLNKVQLCHLIVSSMSAQHRYCPHLTKHEFIEAVVAVLARRALFEAPPLASLEGPIQMILRQEMEKEMRHALDQTAQPLLQEQQIKGRISVDEIGPLLLGVERYLLDSMNGGADTKPKYFYEVMPPNLERAYRPDYKYVFETVIDKTEADFHARVKRNSTIRKLWDYL